jgi:hypothetical protein
MEYSSIRNDNWSGENNEIINNIDIISRDNIYKWMDN